MMNGICRNCGKMFEEGAKFCAGCGTVTNAESAQPPPRANQHAPPVQQQYEPQGQQQHTPPVQQQYVPPPPPATQYYDPSGQYPPLGQYTPPPGQYPPSKKGLSKKTLMIIIIAAAAAVVAIVLLNVFGVFGDSKSDRDDTSGTSGTSSGGSFSPESLKDYEKGWPSNGMPPGFPEYPDGDSYYKISDNEIMIFVFDTNKKAFDSFADSVEAQGYDLFSMEDGYSFLGEKDGWTAYFNFDPNDDTVSMLITDNLY